MIFILIIIWLFIFLMSFLKDNNIFRNRYTTKMLEVLLLFILTLTIGLRSLSSFPDNLSYKYFFEDSLYTSFTNFLISSPMEVGFSVLTWLIGRVTESYTVFFVIIFLLFIGLFLSFLKNLFGHDKLIILAIFTSTPFFISFSANIIRNGLAVSLLLLATYYSFNKKNNLLTVFLLIIAPLFHTAVIPFAIFLVLERFITLKLNHLLWFWILTIALFILKIPSLFLPLLNNFDSIETYASTDAFELYGGGAYRLDFLIFNTLIVIFTLVIFRFYGNREKDFILIKYIKLMLFSAIVFNMFGFIAFSDRLAVYVWLFFLITVLLIIQKSKYQNILMPVLLAICSIYIILTENFIFF